MADDPEHSFENSFSEQANKIIWQKGYSIAKSCLTHADIVTIRNKLRARPISLPNFPQKPSFKVYQETANWLRLPRVWGFQHFGPPDVNLLSDCVVPKLPWTGSLRQDQSEPYDAVIQHLTHKFTGILSLPTGRGKTFIALAVLAHFNQRCLIIVHTSHLLNQWKKELDSLFPGCSIGIVQGNKKQFDPTNDFVLCMIQTLLNMPDSFGSTPFGITVVDECHHLSGEVFNTIMFQVQSKYVLGLSATPQRKDGLTYVLNWHLGDVFYKESPKLVGKEGVVRFYHFQSQGMPNTDVHAQKITFLTENQSRSDKIIRVLLTLIAQDPNNFRKILILSERRDHALYLKTQLERLQNSKSCALFLGNMKHSKNSDDQNKDIIVATYALFSEGVSIPHLNTLVLATPKRDIIQSLGRIFRKQHAQTEGEGALIIDFVDDNFMGQYSERRKIYKSQLSRVEFIDHGYL